jgi:hypothetical protein
MMPDKNPANNASKKRFGIRPLMGLNTTPSYKLYILPVLGGNANDGLMLGTAIHNITAPGKKLEYAAAPMFALGSKQFVYTGYANYFLIKNNATFQDISLTFNSKKFSNAVYSGLENNRVQYLKNKIGLTFNFMPKDYSTYNHHSLNIAVYNISQNSLGYSIDSNRTVQNIHKKPYEHKQYYTAQYLWNHPSPFNPHSIRLYAQAGDRFGLISVDARYKIHYRSTKKGINFRAFAGKLLSEKNVPQYGMLSITHSEWNDYLYDHTFIARNHQTGFGSTQSSFNGGGFYTNTLQYANKVGLSNNFLLALNANVEIPQIPLSIFANIAYIGQSTYTKAVGHQPVQYEAGLAIHLSDYISIALPILLSNDLNDYRKYFLGKNIVLKSIAFRVNLSEILPSRNLINAFMK